jgi:hypothetical protein
MAGETFVRALNQKAGTIVGGVPTLTATKAANVLASSTGLALVGALNKINGTSGINLAGVLNKLAGTTGLDVDGAAAAYSIAATAPGAPTSVSASASGSTVTVTWTAPSNGGSAITAYVIQRSPDGTTWTTQTDTDGNATNATATLTSQANGTYTYRVAATNSVGTGSYGTSGSVVVSSGSVPGAPTFVSSPVFSGDVNANTQAVFVRVSAPASDGGSAILDYRVQFTAYSLSNFATYTLTVTQATSGYTFNAANTTGGDLNTFAGTTSGTRSISVSARNAIGYSSAVASGGTGSLVDTGG